MDDLEKLILKTAQRILPTLTEGQLRSRLARRSSPTLSRPPRGWCLAVRAADTRIADHNAIITPRWAIRENNNITPGRYAPHQLTLDARLLRQLCHTVHLQPGQTHDEVAQLLGVTTQTLHSVRAKGVFNTHYIPGLLGRRGHPVPLLYADHPLDPSARHFAQPDPLWSWTARFLTSRIPDNLQQTLTRVPCYRTRGQNHFRDTTHLHPEHPNLDPHERSPTSRRLPKPPPDYVWYKWQNGRYVAHDWRTPAATAAHIKRTIRAERRKSKRRKQRIKPSTDTGSLKFNGWLWLCPACKRPVKTLYHPLPPLTLLLPLPSEQRSAEGTLFPLLYSGEGRGEGSRTNHRSRAKRSAHSFTTSQFPQDSALSTHDSPAPFLPCFACHKCHRVQHLSPIDRSAWNTLIAHLTAGLLYGREVPKPPWFHPARKRPYRPQSNRPAPRRQQVLRRILSGWSIRRIAQDLQIGIRAVHNHLRALYRQENVKDRHALATKLNSPHPQPQNQVERAEHRRQQVLALLLQGQSYKQIISALGLDFSTLNRDTHALYKSHQVKGHGQQARKALARKLALTLPPTRSDHIKNQIQSPRRNRHHCSRDRGRRVVPDTA